MSDEEILEQLTNLHECIHQINKDISELSEVISIMIRGLETLSNTLLLENSL